MTGAVGSLVGDGEGGPGDRSTRTDGGSSEANRLAASGIVELLRRASQRRTFAVPLTGLAAGEM